MSFFFHWENERYKYDLYISREVIDEISLGDPIAAQKRSG
jgi:hypothetical protein